MKLKDDWIVKNWAFLNSRRVKQIRACRFNQIFKQADAPTTSKFYGTQEFYDDNFLYATYTFTGSRRLGLRPYIIAPMPEQRIKAVFIDPKKYIFDDEGNITGLKECYEVTIFVFIED